jgi:hypothetical protein
MFVKAASLCLMNEESFLYLPFYQGYTIVFNEKSALFMSSCLSRLHPCGK